MKTYEASARTIEEAVSLGLKELGASISDVKVDILEEGSKGLFGLFGSKQAKVRLTMLEEDTDRSVADMLSGSLDDMVRPAPEQKKQPRKKPAPAKQEQAAEAPAAEKPAQEKPVKIVKEKPAQEKPAQEKPVKTVKEKPAQEKPAQAKPAAQKAAQAKPTEPAKPVEPAEQADRATPAGKAQEFLQQVTQMMGVNVAVAVSTDEEGNVRADMEGDTLGILIGRRGETLDALQYLTSLQVNKGQQEYTRVTLDTENYRAKREEALVRLANRMANRAQKTGRKVSMEPMNPYERRILHSALQDNPAVTTHSEGEEPNRHVVITLK